MCAFEITAYDVAQTELKLSAILLPKLPERWGYTCVPLHPDFYKSARDSAQVFMLSQQAFFFVQALSPALLIFM